MLATRGTRTDWWNMSDVGVHFPTLTAFWLSSRLLSLWPYSQNCMSGAFTVRARKVVFFVCLFLSACDTRAVLRLQHFFHCCIVCVATNLKALKPNFSESVPFVGILHLQFVCLLAGFYAKTTGSISTKLGGRTGHGWFFHIFVNFLANNAWIMMRRFRHM